MDIFQSIHNSIQKSNIYVFVEIVSLSAFKYEGADIHDLASLPFEYYFTSYLRKRMFVSTDRNNKITANTSKLR